MDCQVSIKKCDQRSSSGSITGGGKRSKTQSPASRGRGKQQTTTAIDKNKFYSVDQLTRRPLHCRTRQHVHLRNHHGKLTCSSFCQIFNAVVSIIVSSLLNCNLNWQFNSSDCKKLYIIFIN